MQQIELPPVGSSIDISGPCFKAVIAELASRTSAYSARLTQRKSTEIVLHSIRCYRKAFGGNDVGTNSAGRVNSPYVASEVPPGINGLMYGRVQSGKTNASIATVALASGNGFRCFVVLTSDNTWLGRQTVERFRLQLGAGDGPIVRSWEDWRTDPREFAAGVRPYLEDTGIVLVSTKNTKNLENLAHVLNLLAASRVPAMILDDEADNASLNTNTSRMAAGTSSESSRIFALIGEIREGIPNHVFIQITATPQSLLLQGVDHPLRPAWVVSIEPGDDYVGGETFFETESPHIVHVDGTEIDDIRAGRITPGDSLEIPKGLAKAVCFFATATALRQLEFGSGETLSMLIHIDHKKISHKAVRVVVTKYLMWLDKALRKKLSASDLRVATAHVTEAITELGRTHKELPAVDDILARLQSCLRNAQPQIIDADNPNQKPEYRPGMNFLIGGNRLGRGVTVDGLTVTYYARDAKKKMMDTVHQHARMFGYRKRLLAITRLYSPEHIVGALRDIYAADEGTRRLVEDDGKLSVKPVWVGPSLLPTRANVLNPADLRAIVGGIAIWPTEIVHTTTKIKHLVASLEQMLNTYGDRDRYYEVSVEIVAQILALIPSDPAPTRTWNDGRIQELLKAIRTNPVGINQAIVNVRRGRRGNEGFHVSRDKQYSSGFAEGTQINYAKSEFPDRPVLLLRKQAGRAEEGWKDQEFYAPTLIVPQTKFAFVFVDS